MVNEEQQHNADMSLLQAAADSLGEHFDSVIIITTRGSINNNGDTEHFAAGSGNIYAQIGSAFAWLEMERGDDQ